MAEKKDKEMKKIMVYKESHSLLSIVKRAMCDIFSSNRDGYKRKLTERKIAVHGAQHQVHISVKWNSLWSLQQLISLQ
jgi:hypothetical protein